MAPLAGLLATLGCRSASAVAEPSKTKRSGKVVRSSSPCLGLYVFRSAKDRTGSDAKLGDSKLGSCDFDGHQSVNLILPEEDSDLTSKMWRSQRDMLVSREAQQSSYQQACRIAISASLRPVSQGRLTLVSFFAVQLLRVCAWLDGESLGTAVYGLHFLVAASDVSAFMGTAPVFFFHGVIGCTEGRRAGLMLTLVFALSCVVVGAVIVYCFVCPIKPFSPGQRSLLKIAEAYLDLWECTMIASAALHVSLLTCCWRVYKELRMNGLYPATPPGARIQEVSVFEVLCEVEDLDDIKRGKCACCANPGGDSDSGSPLVAFAARHGAEADEADTEEVVSVQRPLEEATVYHTVEWRKL